MAIKTFSSTPGADNSVGLVKDIRAEFGGTPGFAPDGRIKQASISQYYKGGTFVPSIAQNSAVPTAGQIRFTNYYGARTASTPPVYTFPNAGFESGSTGWTFLNAQIHLNGGTTILGWPTPTDPTPNPYSEEAGAYSPGDVSAFSGPNSYISSSPFGAGSAAYLNIPDQYISIGGTILYGPVLYSNNPVYVVAGTILTFNWYAVPGGDAYNVYGYMLNPVTGATIEILDDMSPNNGGLQTTTKTFTAGQAGTYHFVFVCGAYDYTHGTFIGATLVIDNVTIDNTVLTG
jgi:hypothetical protein